jgi:subtilisin-like proprotein convertase family protein
MPSSILDMSMIYSVIDTEGTGTLATRSIPTALSTTILKNRTSGLWASSGDPEESIGGAAGTYDIGTFALPEIMNDSRACDLYILTRNYSAGSGTLKIYAEFGMISDGYFASYGGATEVLAVAGNGWSTADELVIPADARYAALRLFAVASATRSCDVAGVSVLAQQDSSEWEKISLTHCNTEDRPYDVYTLRRIGLMQAHVLERYPRALVTRGGSQITASVDGGGGNYTTALERRDYRVRRGTQDGDVTIWVYADCSPTNGTLKVYCDPVGAGGTTQTADGNASITGADWYSRTIESALWDPGEDREIVVKVESADPPAGPAASAYIFAVVAFENDYTLSDFVITSGGRSDWLPHRVWPGTASIPAGNPIVSSFRGNATYFEERGDLFGPAQNAVFAAAYRPQTLIADGRPETGVQSGKSTSPNLWATKHATTRGCDRAWVRALVKRSGVTDSDRAPELTAFVDGVAQDATARLGDYSLDRQVAGVWLTLGVVEVTEHTVHDIGIGGGFVLANGTAASASNDSFSVLGVNIEELATQEVPQKTYFYGANATGGNIPDNTGSSLTSTITVPSANDFVVRGLRVGVTISHATPAQVKAELTHGAITRILASTMSSATMSWSDAITGDSAPTDTLVTTLSTDFREVDSVGNWTLKLTDSTTGTAGTLTSWWIELW